LAAQAGQLDLGVPIFSYFGGTETMSSTYEEFRAGSVAALRLLALRFPQNPAAPAMLTATGRYNEILTALLALGAEPWWDRQGHANARGAPYYDGPTVSPVSERSTPAHAYQNDLGPFLALAAGLPLNVSKREDWPMGVVRQVAALDPTLGIDPSLAASCRALVQGDASALSAVVGSLAGVKLFSQLEWTRFAEGLLVTGGPRLNFNTPKIFWSFADNASQTMQIGFPWQGGQHRGAGASTAAGGSQILTNISGGLSVIAQAEQGHDASYSLPASTPLYHVIGDTGGIRIA
ncbi:MAG TPA: hypothetical protein VMM92_10265, partial [Thermoanaerobaculia bacterium]|nr:hypothetical protein [Thermoanaerobaculia bacterium]